MLGNVENISGREKKNQRNSALSGTQYGCIVKCKYRYLQPTCYVKTWYWCIPTFNTALERQESKTPAPDDCCWVSCNLCCCCLPHCPCDLLTRMWHLRVLGGEGKRSRRPKTQRWLDTVTCSVCPPPVKSINERLAEVLVTTILSMWAPKKKCCLELMLIQRQSKKNVPFQVAGKTLHCHLSWVANRCYVKIIYWNILLLRGFFFQFI